MFALLRAPCETPFNSAKLIAASLMTISLLGIGAPVFAEHSALKHNHLVLSQKEQKSYALSPKEAAALAKRRHGGKVVGIRRLDNVYRVRLMKEGRIREVTIPVRLNKG